MYPRQGEIYYIDLADQGGLHYVMVLPDSRFNKGRRTLIVPFTSQNIDRHTAAGNGAVFEPGSYPFLSERSVVPSEWLGWCISGSLDNPIATLSQNDVNRVLTVVANFLGIPTYMDTEESV